MKFDRYEIKETENGQKIYFFLKNLGHSERNISQLRAPGALKVNGENANMRTILKTGDVLSVQQTSKKRTEIAESDGTLEILFEDDDFLIVNKPAMLACTPTRSHYTENLGGQICRHMKQEKNFVLRILNRLDLETSGIVVVAKNSLACKTKIEKEYHALAEGEIGTPLTINLPIETLKDADGRNVRKRIVSTNGKIATTHVTPIQTFHKNTAYTLASITLETGRTHQIRVHLSHISHPFLGDSIYNWKENENSATNATHTMLILKKISFKHFRTQETLSFEVPYPQDWKPFLN